MAKIVIGETEYDILNSAMQAYCWDKDFSIYTNNKSCFSYDLYYGINWSATGTQSTENATKFLVSLALGIDLVKAINEVGASYSYDKDLEKIKSAEEYDDAKKYLLDAMNAGRFGEVADWIKSMAA